MAQLKQTNDDEQYSFGTAKFFVDDDEQYSSMTIFQNEKQNQNFLSMWLSSTPQYIGVFIKNGFDLEDVLELDDKTLCDMNILDEGHRLTILRQAQKLLLQFKKTAPHYGTSQWIRKKKHKRNLYKYSDDISSGDTGFPDIDDKDCTVHDILQKAHCGPNEHAPSQFTESFECLEDSDADTLESVDCWDYLAPLTPPRKIVISIMDATAAELSTLPKPCLPNRAKKWSEPERLIVACTWSPPVDPEQQMRQQCAYNYFIGNVVGMERRRHALANPASNNPVLRQSTTKLVTESDKQCVIDLQKKV